jgi:hypothetical protein
MQTSQTALKEWAVIVDALGTGEQFVLLRKGGILDVGGEFSMEASEFLLWPTYLHQDTDWLAEPFHDRLAPCLADRPAGPDRYRLSLYASTAAILQVPSRAHLDRLAGEHLWSDGYLDLRWNYRPEIPLHLLILRVCKLPEATLVHETSEQRGCRSWVELDEAVAVDRAAPVVDDASFNRRCEAIRAAMS